ncbi:MULTISPECIES: RICIN domain-containing protein [unclassified Streptomyces]|uniref:RICIN domain-containing protein n=1 Tax=unclassified Streptomyces TaxID=2593676 RepID=UPI00070ACE1D|nr:MULTISPECIES: RICIN domain-containing protein [unclassified Streptomyces]KRD20925.1 lectin [Streptomyces sp. Root264]
MTRSRFLPLWAMVLTLMFGAVMGAVAIAPPVHAATAFASTAVNRGGGNCLDVPGSSTADGLQLIQWTCHGEANQNFTFTPVGGTTDQYGIGTSAGGRCVDVNGASGADNATIVQRACGTGAGQKFRLVPVTVSGTTDVFSLQSVSSGKCVTPAGDSSASGTGLVQLPCTGAAARTWRLPGFTGSGGGPTTPPTKTVRVYWLKPSDVPFDQRYPDGIAKVMREAQRYYRQELGKTFKLNTTVVEVVNGDQPRSWYENTPNGGDRYWWAVTNMQNELARKFGLNNPDSRWLNVGEISAEGEGAGGGASPGWVVLSGHDADGAAGTSGQSMNRWYGGMVHELGHAFGLPDSSSTDGTPMSASFYDYPDTHFSQSQKNQILGGPYGSFLS